MAAAQPSSVQTHARVGPDDVDRVRPVRAAQRVMSVMPIEEKRRRYGRQCVQRRFELRGAYDKMRL